MDFPLSIFADIDECKTNNGGCGRLHCTNQEGSHQCGCKEGFKLRDDGNGCAEILQGASGKISSGNWPENYPVNVDLQWVIQCESAASSCSITHHHARSCTQQRAVHGMENICDIKAARVWRIGKNMMSCGRKPLK